MAPLSALSDSQTSEPSFSVAHQKIELDINLPSRSLRGRTEITINPYSKDLKSIRLNCRQCKIKRMSVNGKGCGPLGYDDPYQKTALSWKAGVHQYHMLQQRLEKELKRPAEDAMTITLPKSLKIDDLDPLSEEAQSILLSKSVGSSKGDASGSAQDSAQNSRSTADQTARFTPIHVIIEFAIIKVRDGLQFVGWDEGDLRYPHLYTTNSLSTGNACCLFPCVDNLSSRCTWEISIKCQKTVRDALGLAGPQPQTNGFHRGSYLVNDNHDFHRSRAGYGDLTEEDKALDMAVICTGDMTDEVRARAVELPFTDLSRSTILMMPRRRLPLSYALQPYPHSMWALPLGPSST